MKIALDTSCLAINPSTGLSEVARHLAGHIAQKLMPNQFGLYMNYFCRTSLNSSISCHGLRIHALRLPRRIVEWWWKYNWPPFDFYLSHYDIFHSLHIHVPPTKKMKTVLTVHDCRYLAFPDLYSAAEVENYRQQMIRSLSRVDAVVTVSAFTRRELLSHFSLSPDRVQVIHNGFSPHIRQTDMSERRVDQFLAQQRFPLRYVLYLGTLDPRKNLKRLIEGLALCHASSQDFPALLLVGISSQQWITSEEAGKAEELGLMDKIFVAGVLPKDLVWGLTQKAFALCYPSLYEGFGFPPLEAMAVGVPVLAGHSSSIPEITGQAACLVDPLNVEDIAAGLARIVANNSYRENLIKSGYSQVKKFSWSKAAEQYIALYRKVGSS